MSVTLRHLLLCLCALVVTAAAGLGQRSAVRGTFGFVERVYFQAGVLVPGWNPAGIVFFNGGHAVVGNY